MKNIFVKGRHPWHKSWIRPCSYEAASQKMLNFVSEITKKLTKLLNFFSKWVKPGEKFNFRGGSGIIFEQFLHAFSFSQWFFWNFGAAGPPLKPNLKWRAWDGNWTGMDPVSIYIYFFLSQDCKSIEKNQHITLIITWTMGWINFFKD